MCRLESSGVKSLAQLGLGLAPWFGPERCGAPWRGGAPLVGQPVLDQAVDPGAEDGAGEHRDQDRPPMVTVTKDGPYVVTGAIELFDQARGEGASSEHYALCRCGGSKNKPFCDGTHWHIGFSDDKT